MGAADFNDSTRKSIPLAIAKAHKTDGKCHRDAKKEQPEGKRRPVQQIHPQKASMEAVTVVCYRQLKTDDS